LTSSLRTAPLPQVEYDTTAGGYQNKEVHFDFTNRHLRYDMVYLDGPKKLSTILNFTSLWLNDTLCECPPQRRAV
jgi:hypothetical protein